MLSAQNKTKEAIMYHKKYKTATSKTSCDKENCSHSYFWKDSKAKQKDASR
jgi:hypothetical protein